MFDSLSRREFLRKAALAGTAVAAGTLTSSAPADEKAAPRESRSRDRDLCADRSVRRDQKREQEAHFRPWGIHSRPHLNAHRSL